MPNYKEQSGQEKAIKSIEKALKINPKKDEQVVKKFNEFVRLRKAPEMDRPREGLMGEGRAHSYPIRNRDLSEMDTNNLNNQPLNQDLAAFNAQADAEREARIQALQQLSGADQMRKPGMLPGETEEEFRARRMKIR